MDGMRAALATLRPGERAVLVELPAEAGAAHELAALRLLPGEDVEVVQALPFGGPMIIRNAGGLYAVGRDLAERLVVMR